MLVYINEIELYAKRLKEKNSKEYLIRWAIANNTTISALINELISSLDSDSNDITVRILTGTLYINVVFIFNKKEFVFEFGFIGETISGVKIHNNNIVLAKIDNNLSIQGVKESVLNIIKNTK